MGLDLKLTDAAGATLPEQRDVTGHLKVKGASVVQRYFKAQSDVVDAEGYFDTGDLASIDGEGNLTISGRSKDLIKSGGEWINPAEIETIVGRLPGVGLVAVHRPARRQMGRAARPRRRDSRRAMCSTTMRCLTPCAATSPIGGFPTR